jgi:hypothetical protein
MNVNTIGCMPSWCNGVPFPEPSFSTANNLTTYQKYCPQQVLSFKSIDPNTMAAMPRSRACLFSPYLKNEKLLRCPADIPNANMYKRQQYLTTYAWNCALDGYDYSSPGNAPSYRLSLFNASDVLIWEDDENYAGQAYWYNDTANNPTQTASARHGKGATIGRFGGSAERIARADFITMGASANRNDLWCNPMTSNGH